MYFINAASQNSYGVDPELLDWLSSEIQTYLIESFSDTSDTKKEHLRKVRASASSKVMKQQIVWTISVQGVTELPSSGWGFYTYDYHNKAKLLDDMETSGLIPDDDEAWQPGTDEAKKQWSRVMNMLKMTAKPLDESGTDAYSQKVAYRCLEIPQLCDILQQGGLAVTDVRNLSYKENGPRGERARVYFRGQIITTHPQTLQVL